MTIEFMTHDDIKRALEAAEQPAEVAIEDAESDPDHDYLPFQENE